MIRRVLAGVAAATWLAGCVSILGVDPEDHRDVAEVVCGCAGKGVRADTCAATVASILEDRPRLEDAVFDCVVENERACAALDACLLEAKVCSRRGGDCSGTIDDNGVNLRCCEGFECEGGTCREQTGACLAPGEACGDGDTCCSGEPCTGDGQCPSCAGQQGSCAGGFPCCDTSPQLVCSAGTCLQCAESLGSCNDQFPCCGSGDCPVGGTCL